MRSVRGRWRLVGAVMALAGATSVGLSGCGPARGADLVVYSGQHAETTDALVAAFERATGVTVTVRTDSEDVLADLIVEEGAASPADVIYTENSPALQFLASRHRLAEVDPATLAAVGRRHDSPAGNWVGVSARVSVLVYNTGMLHPSELPRSVLDLASPKWRDKLAIAPQETDFQPIVTAVAAADGPAAARSWLRGIRANGAAHEYQDNETVTAMVNSGQAEIGVINQYYWYRLRADVGAHGMHSAIAFFSPRDPGYVEDVSGAGIVASTRHLKAAQQFLAFLVSRAGQEIVARSNSFEYPLRPGVRAAPGLAPLSSLRPDPISIGQLGDGAGAISLMRAAGLLP